MFFLFDFQRCSHGLSKSLEKDFLLLSVVENFNFWTTLFSKMMPNFWRSEWTSVKVKPKSCLYFTNFLLKSTPCWLTLAKLYHWGHTKLFIVANELNDLVFWQFSFHPSINSFVSCHYSVYALRDYSWEAKPWHSWLSWVKLCSMVANYKMVLVPSTLKKTWGYLRH